LSFEPLIAHYGLIAIFIGAAIEGETVVFLGGVLAHRHLMPFWAVAVAASAGSFVADQIFFFTGRYARGFSQVQNVIKQPAFARVTGLIERHPIGFILAFRFIYGMRTISPIAIGASQIPAPLFVLLNALAAAVWGPVIAGIGYVFGNEVEQLFGRLPLDKHLIVAAGTVLVVLVAYIFLRKRAQQ
jgi:membrane protein DedA with SNARE-associated domain